MLTHCAAKFGIPNDMAEPSPSHLLGAVAESCGIISRNNGGLANMVSQLDSAHPSDAPDPHDLRLLLQDNASLARETGAQLLMRQRCQGRESMTSHERAMQQRLSRDFQFVLRRFQELTHRSSQAAAKQQLQRSSSTQHSYSSTAGAGSSAERPAWLRQAVDRIAPPSSTNTSCSGSRNKDGSSALSSRSAADAGAYNTGAYDGTYDADEDDLEAQGEGRGLLASAHAREQRHEQRLSAARAEEHTQGERARMVEQASLTQVSHTSPHTLPFLLHATPRVFRTDRTG